MRVTIASLVLWVRGLEGWRRARFALLLGALAALAMPPVHAVPLLFIAFPGLIWLIDGVRRPAAAFAVGWWFGLGHFSVGIYWIAHALLTEPEKFAWMIPFVVGGLAALLAVFPGLAALTARLAWNAGLGGGVARILVLAIAWTGFEWLRGWIFTGFPWNLLGYVWAFSEPMIQFAAIAGIWGLSLVTLIAAGLPAVCADGISRDFSPAAGASPAGHHARQWLSWSRGMGPVAASLLILAGLWVGGALRLVSADEQTVEGVTLRLVQAGIDPSRKGRDGSREEQLAKHLRLTLDTPGFDSVSHVVWPETAVPFLIEREPQIRSALATAAPAGGMLLTGAPRGAPASGPLAQVWNSMVAIDEAGTVLGTFDKFHLVPLGEYVPLRDFLPFLSKITPGSIDFSAGPGPQTLRLPGLPPVSPLICYEVIFPGAVVDDEARPGWMLNLTNDAWFGISSGPYQHFASARLRAVEEGLPLVRAANTGISGVVDAYGRVTARLGLGETGVLDVPLPKPAPGLTPYARFGDWSLAAFLALVGLVAVALRRWIPRSL
ncbi:apolipoprotein N-acyltransferase [Rhodospirillaceae bacterium SYSU D60014]|uniref:apolipoprotein N-acyltransferase n=1 Tax=Virgifigura deserti TaxID=2268457 RepID=UPI000E669D98